MPSSEHTISAASAGLLRWLLAMTKKGDGQPEDDPLWDDDDVQLASPEDPEGTETERQCELLAKVKRREVKMITFIVCLLVLVTLYFAVLNAVIIHNREVKPYELSLEMPSGMAGDVRYALSVSWEPMVGSKEKPIRPSLNIDGQWEVSDRGGSGLEHRSIDLREVHHIGIEVPEACTPGEHRGKLLLEKVAGHASLPLQQSIPVVVKVTGGFWHSWFLLRNWLAFLLIMAVVLYVFCLVKYPLPKGKLLFYNTLDGTEAPTLLPRQRRSWIFPWLRSTVPLGKVIRRAGMPRPWRIQASLDFLLPNMPVLVLYSAVDRRRMVRFHLDTPCRTSGVNERPVGCSIIELMTSAGHVLGYEISSADDHERRGYVRFQYKG